MGDPDGAGGWVTRYYYNPGVAWMWFGALLMGLGGLVSVCDRRLRIGAPRRIARRSAGPAIAAGLAALLLCAPSQGLAIDADEMFQNPAQEARALAIGKQLRCLVCQNQSIFDSNADLARDLRSVVRERIAAGDTDDEAMAYIVARYGDYVLLRPPVKPATYVLWLAPLLLLAAAAFAARRYSLARRRGPPQALSGEDRERARRVLEGEAP